MKHIHILGVCGTFMASMAILAKSLGFKVTGSDEHVYPPMSDVLADHGIEIMGGYEAKKFPVSCDQVIVGNALSRGLPIIEAMLNQHLDFQSGPRWLYENVLKYRHVVCVSGTHGKTTTSSLLAWILTVANKEPGFLIGGVCPQLGASAQLGQGDYFVIEGDEYDTAFFDKRSKFVHYHPQTLLLNNLEFDHADIFDDLSAIQRQMHHLLKIMPSTSLVINNAQSPALKAVLDQGLWSRQASFGVGSFNQADWQARLQQDDGGVFVVSHQGKKMAEVAWSLLGQHNVENGLAAMIAANELGVSPAQSAQALAQFKGVKRRLECIGVVNNISIYDDFAHHPTAIKTTLDALRAKLRGNGRIVAVFEPRSNTMKMGVHGQALAESFAGAEAIWTLIPDGLCWDIKSCFSEFKHVYAHQDFNALLSGLTQALMPNDHVVIMSNGAFGGIHQKLMSALANAP